MRSPRRHLPDDVQRAGAAELVEELSCPALHDIGERRPVMDLALSIG